MGTGKPLPHPTTRSRSGGRLSFAFCLCPIASIMISPGRPKTYSILMARASACPPHRPLESLAIIAETHALVAVDGALPSVPVGSQTTSNASTTLNSKHGLCSPSSLPQPSQNESRTRTKQPRIPHSRNPISRVSPPPFSLRDTHPRRSRSRAWERPQREHDPQPLIPVFAVKCVPGRASLWAILSRLEGTNRLLAQKKLSAACVRCTIVG